MWEHLLPEIKITFVKLFHHRGKIINDPVYGFLQIPSARVFEMIQHPYIQRLRRIRQLGLSELVYPGATHTRFHHALGALNLMIRALSILRQKGVEISEEECEAAWLGILLHDVGHGPFSHALEHSLVRGVSHETFSALMMEKLNHEFGGALTLAIKVFKNQYPEKPFLYQLISGQLDMDRLDYLVRDSFYTGVSEGVVGTERIIHMLHVHEGNLVVEEKGIYSIEKFLVARRLMYWQVYLHKTVIAADILLLNILNRARSLASSAESLGEYHPLVHFLGKEINKETLDDESLALYSKLDDHDIMTAIKSWSTHSDFTLNTLSNAMLNRKLPKVIFSGAPYSEEFIREKKEKIKREWKVNNEESEYFMGTGLLENHAYKNDTGGIRILQKDGGVRDLIESSDNAQFSALNINIQKYYFGLMEFGDW